ncbi:transcriptional regulator NrdR [Synoicihabitans lomoniglobus]|uniref:Transcriptional repressor NrdR n=1 Tax=Synoicihabitans lomoniglobus TaxID=2909285 RepID=A0AAF0CP91_9BACT|nr:transcriptional regulator NrdR [Opitutaceae bacterium LMO-M01]WED65660.1 transcriptional regulator NrdR [Opitutaceae bacterium LMO-M01]
MRCSKCTSIDDKVIDSRISKEGTSIRRRRECLECGHRFSTTEMLVREGLMVVKRDDRREEFDRHKLGRSIHAACHKRPIDEEQILMLVEDVIDVLEAQFDTQIPSRAIGDAVMQRLSRIDQVAYVRFASIYKQFRDASEFIHEINALDRPQA